MRRNAVIAALIIGLSLVAAVVLPRDPVSAPREPGVPPTMSLTPSLTPPPDLPPPIKEVKCKRGSGHGLSYEIDGDRHCFKEVSVSPVPSPSTSSDQG